MEADKILGLQDFRADEKSMQIFNQLMGRTGRRGKRGMLVIQTYQKEHPVLSALRTEDEHSSLPKSFLRGLLAERREFCFAPYVRMVKITVRHRSPEKLKSLCAATDALLHESDMGCREITGPFVPVIDKIRGYYLRCYYIKLDRNLNLKKNKSMLLKKILSAKLGNAVVIDVDP
jgi:primosomal protein N' (replication factor Y)